MTCLRLCRGRKYDPAGRFAMLAEPGGNLLSAPLFPFRFAFHPRLAPALLHVLPAGHRLQGTGRAAAPVHRLRKGEAELAVPPSLRDALPPEEIPRCEASWEPGPADFKRQPESAAWYRRIPIGVEKALGKKQTFQLGIRKRKTRSFPLLSSVVCLSSLPWDTSGFDL